MTKHDPVSLLDGLYMFFCQGFVDFVAFVKDKLGKG